MMGPPVSSSSSASRAASTAAVGTGPSVPALRYAKRSRTGNSVRNAAGSMRREARWSTTADGPGRAALLRVEHRRAAVLLGLGRGGGVAGAADGRPGGPRELVLAVEAVAGVGGGVAARLARRDGLQVAGRGHRASGA